MRALDVVCVGEALVDFLPTQVGQRVREVETWVRCSGGAPANVAVGLARLGAKSALVGVTGADEFGAYLLTSLAHEGVDTSHLRQTTEGKTGLAFVSITETGERTFSFYRQDSAEMKLGPGDIDAGFLGSAKVVHFGTNSLLTKAAQDAAQCAIDAARAGACIISCDPNLRLHLWKDPGDLRKLLGRLLPACHVVKLSEDEIEFVTGTKDPQAACAELRRLGVALPVVTRGALGAVCLWEGAMLSVAAPKVSVLDATGAGDGFSAGFLFGLSRLVAASSELPRLTKGQITALLELGCAVGSKVVTQLGAVGGLPKAADVLDAVQNVSVA